MSEVKKCPKCSGEMEQGKRIVVGGGITFAKRGDLIGDKIIPFYCKNCGFIEIYKEMKGKKD
jgi:predicted nucleic-acid-binding Zn-ribbon protein